MREILFRGKSVSERWVEGSYYKQEEFYGDKTECHVIIESKESLSYDQALYYAICDPDTIGQYTGLIDKNGKKIFEGDIVTMPAYAGGKHKAVVYFKNGKFAVDGSNYGFKDIAPKRMEVIGNIHDNPELLSKKE